MLPFPLRMALSLALSIIALTLVSCKQQNPLDEPAIAEAISDIKDLKGEIRSTRGRLLELETDVNLLVTDVTDLKAAASRPATESKAAFAELQKEITGLKTEIATLRKELADLKKARVAVATPRPATTPRSPRPTARPGVRTPPARPTIAVPNMDPKEKGSYYLVKKGDTVDKIASANGVSAAKIRQANRIPAGKNPAEGTRIFIPAP